MVGSKLCELCLYALNHEIIAFGNNLCRTFFVGADLMGMLETREQKAQLACSLCLVTRVSNNAENASDVEKKGALLFNWIRRSPKRSRGKGNLIVTILCSMAIVCSYIYKPKQSVSALAARKKKKKEDKK